MGLGKILLLLLVILLVYGLFVWVRSVGLLVAFGWFMVVLGVFFVWRLYVLIREAHNGN